MSVAGLVREVRGTVGFLPDEPAGLIATRTAGAALLRATLRWPDLDSVPASPILPEPLASASCSLSENGRGATLLLESETRAATRSDLGAALDDALRVTAAYAARTDAILEVAMVRTHEPRAASRQALETLASDLLRAGFRVSFAPSATLAPAADVWVGTRGSGGEIEDFLYALSHWNTI